MYRRQHRLQRSKAATRQLPRLRFAPTAWAKLLYLRDRGHTEIGGFGISSADDLSYVEEFELLPQRCTSLSVAFDDVGIATYFDEQVDRGRRPEQFARIWIHTHPGSCPSPSQVDEATFHRVFEAADWAVMCILARSGRTYARLCWRRGLAGALPLVVNIDYRRQFSGSDRMAWDAQYRTNVRMVCPFSSADVGFCSASCDTAIQASADIPRRRTAGLP